MLQPKSEPPALEERKAKRQILRARQAGSLANSGALCSVKDPVLKKNKVDVMEKILHDTFGVYLLHDKGT